VFAQNSSQSLPLLHMKLVISRKAWYVTACAGGARRLERQFEVGVMVDLRSVKFGLVVQEKCAFVVGGVCSWRMASGEGCWLSVGHGVIMGEVGESHDFLSSFLQKGNRNSHVFFLFLIFGAFMCKIKSGRVFCLR
jgi:hypothetical protein